MKKTKVFETHDDPNSSKMTVQDLIDALQKIDNKNAEIIIQDQSNEYWEIENILFSKSLITLGEDEVTIKLAYV